MRHTIGIIAAVQLLLITAVRAELPKPTCQQYASGYNAIVQSPVSLEDDSVIRIARALARNKLYTNPERTEYATAEILLQQLAALSVVEALTWIFHAYDHLENRMRGEKCSFEKKDVHLMLPRLPANNCKAPADLPKKLPK